MLVHFYKIKKAAFISSLFNLMALDLTYLCPKITFFLQPDSLTKSPTLFMNIMKISEITKHDSRLRNKKKGPQFSNSGTLSREMVTIIWTIFGLHL